MNTRHPDNMISFFELAIQYDGLIPLTELLYRDFEPKSYKAKQDALYTIFDHGLQGAAFFYHPVYFSRAKTLSPKNKLYINSLFVMNNKEFCLDVYALMEVKPTLDNLRPFLTLFQYMKSEIQAADSHKTRFFQLVYKIDPIGTFFDSVDKTVDDLVDSDLTLLIEQSEIIQLWMQRLGQSMKQIRNAHCWISFTSHTLYTQKELFDLY